MKNAFIMNDEKLGLAHEYTGSVFQRVRLHRAVRKDQICFHCLKVIKKGDPSAYYSGRDQGFFYYYHVCDICYEEMIT